MMVFYRSTILAVLSMQILWFFVPWGFAYDENSLVTLTYLGSNAFVETGVIIWTSNILTIGYIFSYTGMFFFKSWARRLFLSIALIGGIGILLYGLSIASAPEAMLGYFITLGDGFIIALAYFTPNSKKFGDRNNKRGR